MNTCHDIIIFLAYFFTSGVAGRRQMPCDYLCSNFILCIVLLLLCTVLSLLQEYTIYLSIYRQVHGRCPIHSNYIAYTSTATDFACHAACVIISL